MVKKENSSLIELTLDEKKLLIQFGETLLAWIIAVQEILIILKIRILPTHPSHSSSLLYPSHSNRLCS